MFDVRFGIKVIEPVMIKIESDFWINLQYLKTIYAENHSEKGWCVVIQLHPKEEGILKSGFESQEEADKYIDALLDTLRSLK